MDKNKVDVAPQNEMEILLAGDTIEVHGKAIKVAPYSWADTFRLTESFGVIFSALISHIDEFERVLASSENSSLVAQVKSFTDFILSLDEVEDVIKALTNLVAKSTKLSTEDIEGLTFDEFLDVGMAVYEVNKAFFTKRLSPKLSQLMEKITVKENPEM